MNHPGEIARLAAIAAPTVALVNNAQREHLEFMASVDAVARENGAAIAALGADGIAVFPADDAHAPTWRELAGARRDARPSRSTRRPTSRAAAAWHGDHWAVAMQTPAGAATFALRVAGAHNVRNALAASAAALAAGCPLEAIVRGLESFAPVRGRSQAQALRARRRRASRWSTTPTTPIPIRCAPRSTSSPRCRRRAGCVLGDMGEVGDQGPAFHREVGAYASERGIETLWAAGAESANTVGARSPARAPSPTSRR